MHLKIPLILLLALALLASCSKSDNVGGQMSALPAGSGVVAYNNIIYGPDTINQKFDISLPARKMDGKLPVIILIHGGSWVTGSKEDFYGSGIDTFFTANGYALADMNYRLTSNYPYPDAVDDIDSLISFLDRNASKYNINTDQICLFGRSAGAHLAMLYGYSRNVKHKIKVVVDGFGPTDFTDSSLLFTPLGINVAVMLGPYADNAKLWHDASPIFYMSGALPTCIMQGTNDQLVYPKQSEILIDSLKKYKIPLVYIPWVGNGHGWDQSKWLLSKDQTLAFIKNFM